MGVAAAIIYVWCYTETSKHLWPCNLETETQCLASNYQKTHCLNRVKFDNCYYLENGKQECESSKDEIDLYPPTGLEIK